MVLLILLLLNDLFISFFSDGVLDSDLSEKDGLKERDIGLTDLGLSGMGVST